MKKSMIVMVILFLVVTSIIIWSRYKGQKNNGSEQVSASSGYTGNSNKKEPSAPDSKSTNQPIGGLNHIKDKEFQTDLLEYLHADERKDHKKVYNYLSKQFLDKYYPNVKSGDEFQKARGDKYMWESGVKYTEVIDFKANDKTNYHVDLKFEYYAEEVEGKGKIRIFFTKENNGWKYVSEKILEKN